MADLAEILDRMDAGEEITFAESTPEPAETDGGTEPAAEDTPGDSSPPDGDGTNPPPDSPVSDNESGEDEATEGEEGETAAPAEETPKAATLRLSMTGEDLDVTGWSPEAIAKVAKLDFAAREKQSQADRLLAQQPRQPKAEEPAPTPRVDPRREKASGFVEALVRSVADTEGIAPEQARAIVQEGLGSLLELNREVAASTALTPAQQAALARIEAEEAHRAVVARVSDKAPRILSAYGISDVAPDAFADALARMEVARPHVEREIGRAMEDWEVHQEALVLARESAAPAPTQKNSQTTQAAKAQANQPPASKGVAPAVKPRVPLPSSAPKPNRSQPRQDDGKFAYKPQPTLVECMARAGI